MSINTRFVDISTQHTKKEGGEEGDVFVWRMKKREKKQPAEATTTTVATNVGRSLTTETIVGSGCSSLPLVVRSAKIILDPVLAFHSEVAPL